MKPVTECHRRLKARGLGEAIERRPARGYLHVVATNWRTLEVVIQCSTLDCPLIVYDTVGVGS
jgi:hypothetical protein